MVTAHEIGHTLGLEHSPVRHALMSPYYRKLGRSLLLSWDDIVAVQQLYGETVCGFNVSAVEMESVCGPTGVLKVAPSLNTHIHRVTPAEPWNLKGAIHPYIHPLTLYAGQVASKKPNSEYGATLIEGVLIMSYRLWILKWRLKSG